MGGMSRRKLWLTSWALVVLWATSLRAEGIPSIDPLLERPLPPGLVMHTRVIDPARLEGHPLMQRINALLTTSQEWQRVHQETVGLLQFTEAFRFVDHQLKSVGINEGIKALWKRGALLAVGEGQNPTSGGVFLAESDASAKAFAEILQQWAETELGLKYEPQVIDGTPVLAAGDLHVAVLGHRVVWANQAAAMAHVLAHVKSVPAEAVAATDPTLLADLHVSLAMVRKNPGFAKGLENPGGDLGLITFFGGWIDLLRRHERLSISLHAGAGESLSMKVGFRESTEPRSTALAPFFVHGQEQIAPPLIPPGTIQSFSWYRDYIGLWNNREQLAREEARHQAEQGDEDAGKMLQVFGTSFTPSELIAQLGPHFRVVVTEQEQGPYDKVAVDNVLPAAAFLVDLRDEEKFRKMVDPFVRLLGLIQGGEQRVLTVREDYKGASILSFVFRETDAEVRMRARDQYNLRVSAAITRQHFILGTTPTLVQAVIDELDRPADTRPALSQVTEQQLFYFSALARQFGRMKTGAIRRIVFSTGWTVEQAEREYQIALDLLASLGEARVQMGDDADGFTIELLIGPSGGPPP
ncbi:MAG: hypothetical protein DWH91_13845 [Planctomycetota bacterium]|nr:MAG: hypothetical protein DWH91_13845 [Planctomycetota bacterium]